MFVHVLTEEWTRCLVACDGFHDASIEELSLRYDNEERSESSTEFTLVIKTFTSAETTVFAQFTHPLVSIQGNLTDIPAMLGAGINSFDLQRYDFEPDGGPDKALVRLSLSAGGRVPLVMWTEGEDFSCAFSGDPTALSF